MIPRPVTLCLAMYNVRANADMRQEIGYDMRERVRLKRVLRSLFFVVYPNLESGVDYKNTVGLAPCILLVMLCEM